MNLQLVLLLAYAVLLIALGMVIGRRVTTTGGFFVAGRQLGPGLLFATVLAANIGAGSTVGAASLGYQNGIAAWWWVGSAGIGTFFLAFWIGPRMWRVARDHDLQTMGDFLEWRYSAGVRGTVASLLWVGTLALLAGQLMAMARILDAVAGIPYVLACVVSGLVMVAYFIAGGLLASAWVNLVQLVVLVAGFLLALPLALEAAGGSTAWRAFEPTETFWNFWQSGASGWMYIPLLVPAFFVSPGLVQKVYGARDAPAVRRGVALSGLALLAFAALPPIFGMVARRLHPALESPDLALPVLLAELPLLIGTLGLAAVLSAEISSADAILFMLSTSLSRDLYRRFVNPAASDARVLRVARLAALLGGLGGVALALLLPTVISSMVIFYSLLVVSLFVPVVAGLHSRARTPAAFAAIFTGLATLVSLRFLPSPALSPALAVLWNPTLLAILVSALAFAVAQALPSRPRADMLGDGSSTKP